MIRHKNILLVDDDLDDQKFFCDVLHEIAPEIKCNISNNGGEALIFLNTAKPQPSLIFLDLNMPFMNGYECLIRLKKDVKLKVIPVIIFTTSANNHDVAKTHAMGAAYFFTKPFDYTVFGKKLKEVLETEFQVAT